MEGNCVHDFELTGKWSGSPVIHMFDYRSHAANLVRNSAVPSPINRGKNGALPWPHMSKHDPKREVTQAVALDFHGPLLLKTLKMKLNKLHKWWLRSWKSSHPRRRKLDVKSHMLSHDTFDQLDQKLRFCAGGVRRACSRRAHVWQLTECKHRVALL